MARVRQRRDVGRGRARCQAGRLGAAPGRAVIARPGLVEASQPRAQHHQQAAGRHFGHARLVDEGEDGAPVQGYQQLAVLVAAPRPPFVVRVGDVYGREARVGVVPAHRRPLAVDQLAPHRGKPVGGVPLLSQRHVARNDDPARRRAHHHVRADDVRARPRRRRPYGSRPGLAPVFGAPEQHVPVSRRPGIGYQANLVAGQTQERHRRLADRAAVGVSALRRLRPGQATVLRGPEGAVVNREYPSVLELGIVVALGIVVHRDHFVRPSHRYVAQGISSCRRLPQRCRSSRPSIVAPSYPSPDAGLLNTPARATVQT